MLVEVIQELESNKYLTGYKRGEGSTFINNVGLADRFMDPGQADRIVRDEMPLRCRVKVMSTESLRFYGSRNENYRLPVDEALRFSGMSR